MNRVLVRRAHAHCSTRGPGERIADMFCGLGNFTLPIARRGASVVGVEGSRGLVAARAENARLNGLAERVEFERRQPVRDRRRKRSARWGPFDKMLIDPPREGAIELVKALGADAPAAHRLRLLQSRDAGARCRGAGP